MKFKIAVIGAGPSGITALKNLLDQGLDAVAFTKNSEVGGNWIYSEDESHSSVFETTHIISSKTLSQYEDFTFDNFDKDAADYPSHDELRRYFQAYSRKFKLYPHIQFGTMVKECKWIDQLAWDITTEKDTITVDFHQFVKDLKKQLSKTEVSKNLKRYSVTEPIQQS